MSTARQTQYQHDLYLRLTVNYNDSGVAVGKAFRAAIPAGALITSIYAYVVTAFNAGTTNVLTVGTNAATYNNILASGTVPPATAGGVNTILTTIPPLAADALPYATYTYTGTAPTQGQVVYVVRYNVNNDG